MTEQEVLKLRDHGEVTKVQFKERIIDAYDVGCEMVAFSNTHGGQLVIGINDKMGVINALSYQEVQETTNLLGNIASENVIPSILLDIETIAVEGGLLVMATIKEGLNKPYHDNKGIVWVKNGADKRRVFDNAELAEMMSQCGNFAPDEAAVADATIGDIDEHCLKTYLLNRFAVVMAQKGINEQNLRDYTLEQMTHFVAGGVSVEGLMRNLRFIRPDGKLTVAAMLLFGKYPQRWLPTYTAKCICYVGNSVGGTMFRDKVKDADMEVICCTSMRLSWRFSPVTCATCKLKKSSIRKASWRFRMPHSSSLWSTRWCIVRSIGRLPSVFSSLTTGWRFTAQESCLTA